MPDRTEQLQPASFRGVQGLVRTERKDVGGRKLILHEYPNSNRRFVEDLGQIPEKFSIDWFVSGEDWLQRAASLRQALNQEGVGRLVLPTLGSFQAYAGEYTEDASQRSVGEISFRLSFFLGETAIAPAVSTTDTQDVFDAGDNVRSELANEFANNWLVPFDSTNVLVAQFDILTALSTIEDIIKNALSDTADFIKVQAKIVDSVPVLIRTPERLGQAFFSFIDDIAGVYSAVSFDLNQSISSLNSVQKLTEFGSDLSLSLTSIKSSKPENKTVTFSDTGIPFWNATTGIRLKRNSNRKLFVQANRLAALVCAYEQAAAVDYTTKVKVQSARALIENSYNELNLKQAYDTTSIYTQKSVRNAFNALRKNALDVLEQKEQQAFGLATLNRQIPISSYVLAYQLYAEEFNNNADELEGRRKQIRALNPLLSSASFRQDFEVFQSQQQVI